MDDGFENATRDALLELEHRGWDALCNGTGAAFYGEIMTDDGLMVLADGSVMDRSGVVTALEQAPPWARYEIRDVRLVDIGNRGACLVYVGSAWRENGSAFIATMTSVYARREGRWRLALYQQTPIP